MDYMFFIKKCSYTIFKFFIIYGVFKNGFKKLDQYQSYLKILPSLFTTKCSYTIFKNYIHCWLFSAEYKKQFYTVIQILFISK